MPPYMLSTSPGDALTLAYVVVRVCVCVEFVCDGGERGGVSEPALVRVPPEAWLCLFLWRGREVGGGGCWRTQGAR